MQLQGFFFFFKMFICVWCVSVYVWVLAYVPQSIFGGRTESISGAGPYPLLYLKQDLFICFTFGACACLHMRVTVYRWRSEDNLRKLVLFLPPRGFQGSNSGHPTWQLAALSTESSHQPQDSYCSLQCMPDLLAQELPGILLSPHHTEVLQMCATVPSFTWVLGIRRNLGLQTRIENALPAKSSSQPPNTFDLE